MSTKSDDLLKVFVLAILFSVFLVSIAGASGYTVRPSQNIGKDPGSPIAGEPVHEVDPVSLWLSLLLCVFPQLTATPIEVLISLKASLYLGYRKICTKNVLDSPMRSEIFHFIEENPGVHFREMQRSLSITMGTLGYHIHIMEEEGLLRTMQRRGKRHYFVACSPYRVEEEIFITALRNDSLRRIITHVQANHGAHLKKIAEDVGLSRGTVHTDLKYLVELGIVQKEKDGRSIVYTLSEDYSHVLMKYVNCYPKPLSIPADHTG
ncbi:MAG: hypothetical protein PWP08_1476 [Methanofollis sp.]|nr:hypothetical protein [Methanofollis sp.]